MKTLLEIDGEDFCRWGEDAFPLLYSPPEVPFPLVVVLFSAPGIL